MKLHVLILSVLCLINTDLTAALNQRHINYLHRLGAATCIVTGLYHLSIAPTQGKKQHWYHSPLITAALFISGTSYAIYTLRLQNANETGPVLHNAPLPPSYQQATAAETIPLPASNIDQTIRNAMPGFKPEHIKAFSAAFIALKDTMPLEEIEELGTSAARIAGRKLSPDDPYNIETLREVMLEALKKCRPPTENEPWIKATARFMAQTVQTNGNPGFFNLRLAKCKTELEQTAERRL